MSTFKMPPDGSPYPTVEDTPKEVLEQWYTTMQWVVTMMVVQNGGKFIIPKDTIKPEYVGIYLEETADAFTLYATSDEINRTTFQ